MTSMTSGTADNPVRLDEAFMADPHALYTLLRAQRRPVVRAVMPRGLPVWLVTSYRDVRAGLGDPRLAKGFAGMDEVITRHTDPDNPGRYLEQLNETMLTSDPPGHTRLRKLVSRGFTARTIGGMNPSIEVIARDLAQGMRDAVGSGEIDLIENFAYPIPMSVICQLFGVPDADRDGFRDWSNTLTSAAGPEEFERAADALADYLAGLVDRKRAHPEGDMLSVIVARGEDADQLSDPEAVAMAFLLMTAGHETTVNLIGNGVLALLYFPDQLAKLRADRSLLPRAVEEFLRWESPVNLATMRYTTEPVVIAGIEIPEGEVVVLSLGSANRDPERYGNSDEVDVARGDAPNLAFGYGIHYCLGARLARMEAEIAFSTLLDHFPRLSLACPSEGLTWRDSPLVRGLTRLPVRLG